MRGYTLIEILVSLTIISIVFGAGYIAYREFARRQAITSAVRTVTADLRLAQQDALAGKKPEDCTSSTLVGYDFVPTGGAWAPSGSTFTTNNATGYQIRAKCQNNYFYTVKTVSLASGVIMSGSARQVMSCSRFGCGQTLSTVLFKVLGQGTDLPSATTLTLSAFGLSQTITVSQQGRIE